MTDTSRFTDAGRIPAPPEGEPMSAPGLERDDNRQKVAPDPRPFDPTADRTGVFEDDARQVHDWTEVDPETLVRNARHLTVAGLALGIDQAEQVANELQRRAQRAMTLAASFRDVARSVSGDDQEAVVEVTHTLR